MSRGFGGGEILRWWERVCARERVSCMHNLFSCLFVDFLFGFLRSTELQIGFT